MKKIMLVDDYELYLTPARNLGMKTILFKDKRDFIDKIKKINKSFI